MAQKEIINYCIGIDEEGNPIYKKVFPKTTMDQIPGLTEAIQNAIKIKIEAIPDATQENKGIISIGNNLSIDEGKLSLTKENIINALNYNPAISTLTNNVVKYSEQLYNTTTINGIKFNGLEDITNFGISNTDSAVKEKRVNCNNFTLKEGSEIIVLFKKTNINSELSLNVNNTGAHSVIYNTEYFKDIKTNLLYHFIFDGTNYQLLYYNLVQGVKGINNDSYKTGLIELNKNDIGLNKVDNTADEEKTVLLAHLAERDTDNNLIINTYAKKNDTDDLYSKFISTNETLASLRQDIIYHSSNISTINGKLISIETNETQMNDNYEDFKNKYNDICTELTEIHIDIDSNQETATTALDIAHQVETNLTKTHDDINNIQNEIDYALELIADYSTESAEKDGKGKIIHETYATINNPIFTGLPQVPDPVNTSNNQQIANTKFVIDKINEALAVDSSYITILNDIKNELTSDSTVTTSIFDQLANKQTQADILDSISNLNVNNNQILVSNGINSFINKDVNLFSINLLTSENKYSFRDKIDALGREEKAASAVSADVSSNCIGNSYTANKLLVPRKFSITDKEHHSEEILFDGESDTVLTLPSIINCNITGSSESARKFNNVKNIQIDLTNNDPYVTDFSENEITPSIKGILNVENGGTGKNNLNDLTVGNAKKVNININQTDYVPINIGIKDEFARLKVGIEDSTGFLELATADNGNEPIYIRQYFGEFDTLYRNVTLLDQEGNSQFPGIITSNELNANVVNSVDINSNKIDSTNFIGINSTIQNSNITKLISEDVNINNEKVDNSFIKNLSSSDVTITNASIDILHGKEINNEKLISNLIRVEEITDCNLITTNTLKSNLIDVDHIDVNDINSKQILARNVIADKITTNTLIVPTIPSTEEGAIWIE